MKILKNVPAAAAKSLVVSDSVRPHRLQTTTLCRPWDSAGKSTGVGCHFLLQCMKVKSERMVHVRKKNNNKTPLKFFFFLLSVC